MIQFLWRNDSIPFQPIHTQAVFRIPERISHMDVWMSDGKFEIVAYVWVEPRDIHILDRIIFTHFIIETHSLRLAPVQGITGTQRNLSHHRMRGQVGFLLKFAFPLNLDLKACSCYLL